MWLRYRGRQPPGAVRVVPDCLLTEDFTFRGGTCSPSRRHNRSIRFLLTGQPSATSSPWIIR